MTARALTKKAEKLLALAGSPNWHEAELALEKAFDIIHGSQLSELDVGAWNRLGASLAEAHDRHYARSEKAPTAVEPNRAADALKVEAARQIDALAFATALMAAAKGGQDAD